jgi:hypothetical protein
VAVVIVVTKLKKDAGTLEFKKMVDNNIHPSHTLSPIFPNITPLPTVICVNELEFLNAFAPIVFTVFGIITLVRPDPLNENCPILNSDSGIEKTVKSEHSENE